MSDFRFKDNSLSFDERVEALLRELTLDEKISLVQTRQRAVPRLGIKEFTIGAEVARGLVCRGEFGETATTVFPEPFGLAATFDENVMREMGEVTGVETRICHKRNKASLCVWGPTVDAERDPRWGRNEEAYGEDPFLTGTLTAAYTKGMYGDDEKYARVIPTLKHFYANNHEENRCSDNASIPHCLKHDYYLKFFEAAVKNGGAKSLMTAYNEINGIEGLCNPELDSICKRQWGLLFSVTDGGDFIQNVQYHKRDENHVEAIARVYKNHGADIMTDDENIVRDAIKEALDKNLISESDIDKAIFGALKARFMLGEFDSDCPYDSYPDNLLCCEEHYKAAEKAAEESIILLKNSRAALPFSKNEKLAVVGVHADMNFRDWYTGLSDKNSTILDAITASVGKENVTYDSGNDIIALRNAVNDFYFSVSDDGTLVCDSASISENCLLELYEWGDGAVSLKSFLKSKFLSDVGVMKCVSDEPYGWFVKEKFTLEKRGDEYVFRNWQNRFLYITDKGEIAVTNDLKPHRNSYFNIEVFSSGTDRVRRIATEAKQTVVFCGNNPQINARECTDRKHIELPEKQQKLMSAVLDINENAAMFIISGYPYAIHDDRLSAILHSSHGGPAMGAAVAKVLFGDISPAGRCPVTWYESDKELCDIHDYNIIRTRSTYLYYDGKPLFPFGHGLSYGSFRYGEPKLNKLSFEKGERIEITLTIENIGQKSSDEVVQVYVVPPKMSKKLPTKQLKAFKRIFIPKNEEVTLTLGFDINDLAFWDDNTNEFEVYGGKYEIRIGASSADIRRTAEINVNAAEYLGLDVTNEIPAATSCDYLGVIFDTDKALNEYALINDWQSYIKYDGCIMSGKHKSEICVSNPGSQAKLTIICEQTGQVIAEFTVPPTGSLTEFITVTAEAAPVNGVYDLKITTGSMLSLKSFRFF
jgi:beta-glucosidase